MQLKDNYGLLKLRNEYFDDISFSKQNTTSQKNC